MLPSDVYPATKANVITISQMLLKGILQLPYYCLVLFDDVCSLIITPFSFYVYFMCLPAAHIPPYMYILLCLSFGAIQALGVLASFSSETTRLPLRLGEHFCSLKVATTNCVQQPAGNTIERMSRETGKVRFVCCHKKKEQHSVLDIPSDMMYELQLLIINTLLKPSNLDAHSYMIKTGMYLLNALMNRPSTPTHHSYMSSGPRLRY